MRGYHRGQLFLIEIIVALSVLFMLITTLFATQTVTSPPPGNDLTDVGTNIVNSLTSSGKLYQYLTNANYSYYTLLSSIFDETNATKMAIKNAIESAIPIIANFKAYTYRNNTSTGQWELIDIVNYEAYTPSSSQISVVEQYIPGFNGVFDQFRFQLYIWYEVQQ